MKRNFPPAVRGRSALWHFVLSLALWIAILGAFWWLR